MKRHHKDAIQDEEEDEMMDVEAEEKMDGGDDEPLDEEENGGEEGEVPFLDTFYGLSSMDPQERAEASHDMLQHCLLGPQANAKDAAYALKRLLNALCSGRAGARQGNASALVSFLRVSKELEKLQEIQEITNKNSPETISDLSFIRNQLLAATDPGDSKAHKKGSEERDYVFGRLFGILAVHKSGLLNPPLDMDLEDVIEVSKGFVSDLITLYNFKKWMREPAAHAICMILNSYYLLGPTNKDAVRILDVLVNDVVVPDLLSSGLEQTGDDSPLTAEQLAVAIHIQTHFESHLEGLPAPLKNVVLSVESVPSLAPALSETSVVSQPRTHLVWDIVWMFVTERVQSKDPSVQRRVTRDSTPVGGEPVIELLEAIMNHVVAHRLLGVSTGDSQPLIKATHERRALGLSVCRNLMGVEFISSLTGRTELQMTPDIVERVALQPLVIRRLFIDVLGAGNVGKGKQADHMLKPFATQVLDFIAANAASDATEDSDVDMSLPVLRGLLRCEPKFDLLTKAQIVSTILTSKLKNFQKSFWDAYIQYLMNEVIKSSVSSSERTFSVARAAGYIELLYQAGRMFSKASEQNSEVAELQNQVLKFFLVIAYFDTTPIVDLSESFTPSSSKKKSKKKKKDSISAPQRSQVIGMAFEIKARLPHGVRSVASARFFSLLAYVQSTITHSQAIGKEKEILKLLTSIRMAYLELEKSNAVPFIVDVSEKMDTDEASPLAIVQTICNQTDKINDIAGHETKHRFEYALACFATNIWTHMFSCEGDDGVEDEDLDADDEEDKEEVHSFLSDLGEMFDGYSKKGELDLSSLTELCVNVLSSPLCQGNKSRGASPTLLRESIKILWSRGLSYAAKSDGKLMSSEAADMLLLGVGAMRQNEMAVADEQVESETDAEEEDYDDVNVFEDIEDGDVSEGDKNSSDGEEADGEDTADNDDDTADNDVEVDPSKLKSLLEQDLEDDESIGDQLEHHEGADAALVKLIKLKQEARKAGQQAREKIDLSRQQRCTLLLEILLSGKPDGWGRLIATDTLLDIAVSLLGRRRDLEKELLKSTDKGKDSALSEKKALLDKVSSILKSKVLKFKVQSTIWSNLDCRATYVNTLPRQMQDEISRSKSKEHQQLCSAILVLVSKCMESTDDLRIIASIYESNIDDWAHKRTSRVESTFFDQLILLSPGFAQLSLAGKMARVAATARSPYLKSESFRLLGLLHNSSISSTQPKSETEKRSRLALEDSFNPLLESLCSALADEEMKKAKRMREVLKTAEKVILYHSSHFLSANKEKLDELTGLLEKVAGITDSKGVKNSTEKVVAAIKKSFTIPVNEDDRPEKDEVEEELPEGDNINSSDDRERSGVSDKKKGKKKAKSKKKRKH